MISKHDFPDNWTELLPQLVTKLASAEGDLQLAKGIMMTANSIMKRYRYAYSTDELFSEILVCLKDFQQPLTEKYIRNNALIVQYSTSKPELLVLLETQRLMTRYAMAMVRMRA